MPETASNVVSENFPGVAVVIPAYNGEKTILRTVNSVIMQSYGLLELIIVDDGSKDSTVRLVEDFVSTHSFTKPFKIIRHGANFGLSKSLNDGFHEANTDLVLVLHQDCELDGKHWIERAVSLMTEEKIAVVTGYYGISDEYDETLVKRIFGVLRKQFHSHPRVLNEEATFSEGKCDLYRKKLVLEMGGFPANYRIAGEDLVVSYKLRLSGYKIVKSYELPVIQRFGGSAETFSGNLRKEFLFGKVMGGVFSQFKFFLFKNVKASTYSGSRSLHRSTQPPFVLSLIVIGILSFFAWWFIYILIGLLFARCVYYFLKVYPELKAYMNPIAHPLPETAVAVVVGIITDFVYGFGFAYGFFLYASTRKV